MTLCHFARPGEREEEDRSQNHPYQVDGDLRHFDGLCDLSRRRAISHAEKCLYLLGVQVREAQVKTTNFFTLLWFAIPHFRTPCIFREK